MSAQILPFPRRKKRGAKVRRGPCATIIAFSSSPTALEEEFFLHIRDTYSFWTPSEGRLDKFVRNLMLGMAWSDWTRENALFDVARPDMLILAERIIEFGSRH